MACGPPASRPWLGGPDGEHHLSRPKRLSPWPPCSSVERHRQNNEETALEVNIEAEDIPPHLSHPRTQERLGTGWRDDVEVLNEFVELWR
jgi:hypothetical protein